MTTINKDVILTNQEPKTLLLEKHKQYISSYDTNKDEYEYVMTEYLRMSGMYWGLTALDLMGSLHKLNKEEIVKYVVSCQHESGGLQPSPGHDPHLLYTLSGIQILCLLDSVDSLNLDKVVEYIQSLQQEDGSFFGDKWGEIDTRFSFCAVASLSLIGRLDAINVNKAVEFVLSCMNFDGGFGSRPGSESHAGLIYCCIGFLSVTQNLHLVNGDLLGWWLCERQLSSGGLNGRPEKLPDVCYSWWVLASLAILGRLHWIQKDSLIKFVLACQDSENGGFSDRPGDLPDPFHTLFGIAALSLLGEKSLKEVNPTYCMPQNVICKLGLKPQRNNYRKRHCESEAVKAYGRQPPFISVIVGVQNWRKIKPQYNRDPMISSRATVSPYECSEVLETWMAGAQIPRKVYGRRIGKGGHPRMTMKTKKT